jgi:hypothetical protein
MAPLNGCVFSETTLASRWASAQDTTRTTAVFSSPLIAALGSEPSGTLVGKEALRAYWTRALHFEPAGAYFRASSLPVHCQLSTISQTPR